MKILFSGNRTDQMIVPDRNGGQSKILDGISMVEHGSRLELSKQSNHHHIQHKLLSSTTIPSTVHIGSKWNDCDCQMVVDMNGKQTNIVSSTSSSSSSSSTLTSSSSSSTHVTSKVLPLSSPTKCLVSLKPTTTTTITAIPTPSNRCTSPKTTTGLVRKRRCAYSSTMFTKHPVSAITTTSYLFTVILIVGCLVDNIVVIHAKQLLNTRNNFDDRIISNGYRNFPQHNQQHHHDNDGLMNMVKMNLLNRLQHNRPPYHVHQQQQQSQLTEPIFDPNMEELLIDSLETKDTAPKLNTKPYHDFISDQNDDGGGGGKTNVDSYEHWKSIGDDDDDGIGGGGDRNEVDDNRKQSTTSSSWLNDDKLTPGDQHKFLKNVIKSGWIEQSPTKTLLYFLKKVNYLLSNDGEHSKEANMKLESVEKVLNPEEDVLVSEKRNQNKTVDDNNSLANKDTNIFNKNFIETHKNIEIVLDRLMSTPNVVKKRGEGPQLSIDSPLTVLRHRLIVELARREAEKTEKQIAINTEILKKLGRRRRRRRSVSGGKSNTMIVKRQTMLNCRNSICKLDHHEPESYPPTNSIHNEKRFEKKNLFNTKMIKHRFRNNDKLIVFDKADSSPKENTDRKTWTDDNSRLSYINTYVRGRINSRKPSTSKLVGNLDTTQRSSVALNHQTPTTINRYWNLWNQLNNIPTGYRHTATSQTKRNLN